MGWNNFLPVTLHLYCFPKQQLAILSDFLYASFYVLRSFYLA